MPVQFLVELSLFPLFRCFVLAAQFALSHLCWLLTYPLAGWLGLSAGIAPTALVLATLTLSGVVLAFYFGPVAEANVIPHDHPELLPDHPHLRGQPSMHACSTTCILGGLRTRAAASKSAIAARLDGLRGADAQPVLSRAIRGAGLDAELDFTSIDGESEGQCNYHDDLSGDGLCGWKETDEREARYRVQRRDADDARFL